MKTEDIADLLFRYADAETAVIHEFSGNFRTEKRKLLSYCGHILNGLVEADESSRPVCDATWGKIAERVVNYPGELDDEDDAPWAMPYRAKGDGCG